MRRYFFALSSFCFYSLLAAAAPTEKPPTGVVRLAPDFTFTGVGKTQSLRSLRGQAVVLIVARSPKAGDFLKQLKNIKPSYEQFASEKVIIVAAFTGESGPIKTDMPIVVADNGAGIAGAYGVPPKDKFAIAIIGRDGNVDYQTGNVLGSSRIHDVIQNSYALQSTTGRQ
jgi:hypothetical protein